MEQIFYYAIDADEIGKKLEYLLLGNKEKEVAAFSKNITLSIDMVRKYFESQNANIIFAGGDNILIKSYKELLITFPLPSIEGITWSIGIGNTIEKATLALKKAKGLGRNRMEIL